MSRLYDEHALFDLEPTHVRSTPTAPVLPDVTALEDLAFLYTATEMGTNSGIRFAMSVVDAMAWCESDASRGVSTYHVEWAFFWTRVNRFLTHHEGPRTRWRLDLRQCRDDGRCDAAIARLGLRKISLREIPALMRPYGVEVVTR